MVPLPVPVPDLYILVVAYPGTSTVPELGSQIISRQGSTHSSFSHQTPGTVECSVGNHAAAMAMLHLQATRTLLRSSILAMCAMRPGDWTCGECGASPVFASKMECFRCGAPRPAEIGPPVGRQFGKEMRPGDWTCDECGASPNFASRVECFRCGAPRPGGQGGGSRSREASGGFDGPEFQREFGRTRCFIENLSPRTTWQMLKDHFRNENYPVVYASISEDRATGRSKGQGIIQFETVHAAEHAIEFMTGSLLDGNDINIRPDYQERSRRAAPPHASTPRPLEPSGIRDGRTGRRASPYVRAAGGTAPVDVALVERLLAERDDLRRQRDFPGADRLRDELEGIGVRVSDKDKSWWTIDEVAADEARGGAEKEAWMQKPWSRVAGSADDSSVIEEAVVMAMLATPGCMRTQTLCACTPRMHPHPRA